LTGAIPLLLLLLLLLLLPVQHIPSAALRIPTWQNTSTFCH
jgi:hypothetical protein